MKKTRPNPLTATSFSRYKCHATCPRQAKYKFIDKLPEPEGPAMAEGNVIHKGIERYLLGRAATLPKNESTNYGPLAALYKGLRAQKPAVELQLAVDAEWRPVDWFDRRVWFRAKIDAALLVAKARVLRLWDHKTGKMRPEEHAEQLETYTIIAPARWPLEAYDTVEAAMLYVYHGLKPSPAVFTDLKALVPRLRKKWERKLASLLNDKTFKATPGWQCAFCAYSGKKGGPCDAG